MISFAGFEDQALMVRIEDQEIDLSLSKPIYLAK